MKGRVSHFLKDFVSSRIGLLLAVLNFALLFYCYYGRNWNVEPFHYFYESNLLKTLIFLNAPSFLLVLVPFWETGFTEAVGERYSIIKVLYFISILLAITFQWLLIGYTIEKTYRNFKKY